MTLSYAQGPGTDQGFCGALRKISPQRVGCPSDLRVLSCGVFLTLHFHCSAQTHSLETPRCFWDGGSGCMVGGSEAFEISDKIFLPGSLSLPHSLMKSTLFFISFNFCQAWYCSGLFLAQHTGITSPSIQGLHEIMGIEPVSAACKANTLLSVPLSLMQELLLSFG